MTTCVKLAENKVILNMAFVAHEQPGSKVFVTPNYAKNASYTIITNTLAIDSMGKITSYSMHFT